MPVDSAIKRKAVPGVGRPFMRSQQSDIAKGQAWRQSAGLTYPIDAVEVQAQ